MQSLLNYDLSGPFNFKYRAIDMIRAADVGFVGIFLPREAAAISQHLDGGTDRMKGTQTHARRRGPFDDELLAGAVAQWTFARHRIHGDLDPEIIHERHDPPLLLIRVGPSKHNSAGSDDAIQRVVPVWPE